MTRKSGAVDMHNAILKNHLKNNRGSERDRVDVLSISQKGFALYEPSVVPYGIALMCDDIRLAKITTKPHFDNAKCKFYHETIPKAVKMKRMPT